MFKNALPNQLLTLRPRQIMLTIPLQQQHRPISQLEPPIIHQTAHLNERTLRRPQIQRQIQTVLPNRTHIPRQIRRVPREPLALRPTHVPLDLRRQDTAEFPAHRAQTTHPVVVVGQQAAQVAFHRSALQNLRVGNAPLRPTLVMRTTAKTNTSINKNIFARLRIVYLLVSLNIMD